LIDCRGFLLSLRSCPPPQVGSGLLSRSQRSDRRTGIQSSAPSRSQFQSRPPIDVEEETRSEPVTSGRCDASRAATQTTPRSLPGKAGRRIPSDPAGRCETTGRVRALRLRKPSRQRPAAASCDIQIASIRIVPGPGIVALSLHSK